MDDKPITIREGLPWMISGGIVGSGVAVGVGAWLGLLTNVAAAPFLVGMGAAFGAIIGLKIADIRRRRRH